MRNALAKALCDAASVDSKLIFLTADLGYRVFDSFIKKFPKQYVNVGVAEAQMINAAAGLALEGFKPICYSIASFAYARPFEQIQFCLAYPKLPVVVVGVGRGLLYGKDGPSHHSINDISLMNSIPEMTIVNPADPKEVGELFPQMLKISGPSYFTLGKYGEPNISNSESTKLGKAKKIRSGKKLAIISTGEISYQVNEAITILNKKNIFPSFYHFHTIKPIDKNALDLISKTINDFLIIEEHVPIGGLYSTIQLWNNSTSKNLNLFRMSLPDAFILGNLTREEAFEEFDLNISSIVEKSIKLYNAI